MIRLDKFINDTNIDIKRLGQIKQSAIQACKDLSIYCGESGEGGGRGSRHIFGCLSEFIINLNIHWGRGSPIYLGHMVTIFGLL